jgi:hypothetical protein
LIRFLIFVVVVLVAAYTAGDLYLRNYTDHQLAKRISAVVPEAEHATVNIGSFPFVAPLLLSGDVHKISAQAGPVTEGRITFSKITVSLSDVKLNRTALLRSRKVQLVSITGGVATAIMTEAELSQALGGAPIKLTPGHMAMTLRGVTVDAVVSMLNGTLELAPLGQPLVTLQIPTNGLLPCTASVVVEAGQLALSCQVNQVPPALLPPGSIGQALTPLTP